VRHLKIENILGRIRKSPDYNEVVKKGIDFIHRMKKSDNVLIIHHTDIDGYSSAALFLKGLERMGYDNIETLDMDVENLEILSKGSKIQKFDKIIIVDIDVPHLKKPLNKLKSEILIIDHHIPRANMNGKNVVYINPRFEDEELYRPASYVCYKFLSKIIDMKDFEWIAVLGTVGDYAYKDCKDLLNEWIEAEDKDDLPKTDFWKAGNMLYSAIILTKMKDSKLKASEILDILANAEGIKDIKSDFKIKKADKEFERIFNRIKEEFWKNAETFDDIIVSTIRPVVKKIGSPLVTQISSENKDKIIFLLEKRGDKFKISARCQSGWIHLGKLMEKCCGGGGHRHAAGGMIPISGLDDFKKKIVKEIDSLR